jgi:hypothetical protein
MSKQITNLDVQRATFVESLYNSMKKQAVQALDEHKKFISLANTYVNDGLDESECIELLMIDGLSRDTAESYIAMASNKEVEVDNSLPRYSFQFEDVNGSIWSSHDIGRIVTASSDEEAWTKVEEIMEERQDIEFQRIISVNRIA